VGYGNGNMSSVRSAVLNVNNA